MFFISHILKLCTYKINIFRIQKQFFIFHTYLFTYLYISYILNDIYYTPFFVHSARSLESLYLQQKFLHMSFVYYFILEYFNNPNLCFSLVIFGNYVYIKIYV